MQREPQPSINLRFGRQSPAAQDRSRQLVDALPTERSNTSDQGRLSACPKITPATETHDETSEAAVDYIRRQVAAGTPFFCWVQRRVCTRVPTSPPSGEVRQGLAHAPNTMTGMVEHDGMSQIV